MLKEGNATHFVYIIKSGEFKLTKKLKLTSQKEDPKIRNFLQDDDSLSPSIRNFLNNKIQQLTKLKKLTLSRETVQEEEVLTLGVGQIFGEEQIVELIFNQFMALEKSKQTK